MKWKIDEMEETTLLNACTQGCATEALRSDRRKPYAQQTPNRSNVNSPETKLVLDCRIFNEPRPLCPKMIGHVSWWKSLGTFHASTSIPDMDQAGKQTDDTIRGRETERQKERGGRETESREQKEAKGRRATFEYRTPISAQQAKQAVELRRAC